MKKNQIILQKMYQMGEASCHNTNSLEILLVSSALNENVSWPPRSPDLTPLDFFLWGTLKDVYIRLVEGLQNKKK